MDSSSGRKSSGSSSPSSIEGTSWFCERMSWSRLGCLGRFLKADATRIGDSARRGSQALSPVAGTRRSVALDMTAPIDVPGFSVDFARRLSVETVCSGIEDCI